MSDAFWKILALKGIKGGGDTPTQEKTVALDMANGNQIITPDDGKMMTQATVLKPATMAAENIKSGVNIGGVVGSLEGKLPEEEKTVTITENGTTEVNATEGKVMTKVVVTTNVVGNNNKLHQVIDGTITEITAADLSGVAFIRKHAFSNCENLKKVELPNSVVRIYDYAFSTCPALTDMVIPDSVKSIYEYAFSYCNNITTIIIPDSVTTMDSSVFYACKSLSKVKLPNAITVLSWQLFYGCSNLIDITIPNSVITIANYALNIGTSTNKGTITMLSTTPPSIESYTFNKSNLNKIIVPKGSGDTYKAATNWSAFADYIEEAVA